MLSADSANGTAQRRDGRFFLTLGAGHLLHLHCFAITPFLSPLTIHPHPHLLFLGRKDERVDKRRIVLTSRDGRNEKEASDVMRGLQLHSNGQFVFQCSRATPRAECYLLRPCPCGLLSTAFFHFLFGMCVEIRRAMGPRNYLHTVEKRGCLLLTLVPDRRGVRFAARVNLEKIIKIAPEERERPFQTLISYF